MGTIKKNPNDVHIRDAKTTRPGSLEESNAKMNQEIQHKKAKRVKGSEDEGAVSDKPFDAKSNNMHQKR